MQWKRHHSQPDSTLWLRTVPLEEMAGMDGEDSQDGGLGVCGLELN